MNRSETRGLSDSPFDLSRQQSDVSAKIVVAFERISESFRVLLWEKAKQLGLSPIQIQILIFLGNHSLDRASVGFLSREFNLTKATISDAVAALERKGLLAKISSPDDGRSVILRQTAEGTAISAELGNFANPIVDIVDGLEPADRDVLWRQLSLIIQRLGASGVISRQRMCFNCRYYSGDSGESCKLIGKVLEWNEIRIDCPEFIDSSEMNQ